MRGARCGVRPQRTGVVIAGLRAVAVAEPGGTGDVPVGAVGGLAGVGRVVAVSSTRDHDGVADPLTTVIAAQMPHDRRSFVGEVRPPPDPDPGHPDTLDDSRDVSG